MTTDKPIDQMVTLLRHNVRYPAQSLPNKPEFFGLSAIDFPKKAISLGKLKLFPEEVWASVFGNYKDSPMATLNLVRSRLQFFIETNTYPFMDGLANALPNEKILEFDSVIEELEKQFNDARDRYIYNYSALKTSSVQYWILKSSHFNLSPEQMKAAIKNRFFQSKDLSGKFLFRVRALKGDIGAVSSLSDEMFSPEVIAVRKKMAAKAQAELNKDIKDFKVEVITTLRAGVMAAMEDLTEAISCGKWNQKSINALRKYLEGVESMNLMDDKDLQGIVNKTRDQLETTEAKKLKKDGFLRDQLRETIKNQIEKIDQLTVPEIQDAKQLDDAEAEIMDVGRIVDPF